MSSTKRSVPHVAGPTAATFAVLLGWSFLAYLTIRVDSDIVAEAIQVQRWLQNPTLVLSYPGQYYGGVLEYPLIAIAESLAPGQVYALTALRILYLPMVGALAVYSTHLLFPRWRMWPFAAAVAAGPAVLHGMMPIKDLYPFAWLLGMAGTALALRAWQRSSPAWVPALAGVLAGMAVYQHPTTALLVLPLAAAGMVRWAPGLSRLVWWGAGFLIGLIPLFLARFGQSDTYLAYVPQRQGLPNLPGAFGLTAAGWPTAIVPNGWGVQHTNLNDLQFPNWLQYGINAVLAVFIITSTVLAVRALFARRVGERSSDRTVIYAMWSTALIVLIAIVIAVPPVFFYGSALAVAAWITIVAGWNAVWSHVGRVIAGVVVVLAAITSAGSIIALNPPLPGAIGFKNAQAQEVRDVATAIEDSGIPIVFGDYWETLPIAYASSGAVFPVTVPVSRFEFPTSFQGAVRVAVPTGYTALPPGLTRWGSAETAVGIADAECIRLPRDVVEGPAPVRVYECPASVFTP